MKSESWIILELMIAILALTCLGFFFIPVYEKGASYGMQALVGAFTLVIGYKFGRSMPQQAGDPKEGQTSHSTTVLASTGPAMPSLPAVVKQLAPDLVKQLAPSLDVPPVIPTDPTSSGK